jgi:hypothetical protein
MRWVSGLRSNILYTVSKRPLDPRWSNADIHKMLGLCANGQSLGWTEDRAFQVAEAIIFRSKNHGISWPNDNLNNDILDITGEQHESE